MIVLGIETSCDETGVALYADDQGLLGHLLFSQIETHARYGGVVPELASRDHVRKLLPLTKALLEKTNTDLADLSAVAYTAGPGLAGALLVGATYGRTLAWGLDIPAIEVHHMEGHLLAPMLEDNQPDYPFVALLVSGGHSQLFYVKAIGDYQLLGESVDDAAGEAFDKVAKMLELGYPGGPKVSAIAEQGDPERFYFPRPMTKNPGLDFSFSGLKTHALKTLQNENEINDQLKADICIAFEDAIIDTLIIKSKRALEDVGCSRLVLSGGVSANKNLRRRIQEFMQSINGEVYYPRQEFCTDNGAMIAYAGYQHLIKNKVAKGTPINVFPRWKM